MAKRQREEVCATCGHYHDYAGGEPCSICGHTLALSAPPRAATRPGEATPRVLFGSYDNAAMCDLLKSLGVTHVLNTVPTSPELYKSTFTYYTTPTTPPDLGACVAWISQVLNESPTSRVLIFDMTGASRAPAVAAAWLVASEAGMGAGDALARVTAARPGTAVRPEDGAMVAAFEGAIAAARAGR